MILCHTPTVYGNFSVIKSLLLREPHPLYPSCQKDFLLNMSKVAAKEFSMRKFYYKFIVDYFIVLKFFKEK